MVDPQIMERSINSLGNALANTLREREPNISDAEINEAARSFIEFIRILRTMDAEQRARK